MKKVFLIGLVLFGLNAQTTAQTTPDNSPKMDSFEQSIQDFTRDLLSGQYAFILDTAFIPELSQSLGLGDDFQLDADDINLLSQQLMQSLQNMEDEEILQLQEFIQNFHLFGLPPSMDYSFPDLNEAPEKNEPSKKKKRKTLKL